MATPSFGGAWTERKLSVVRRYLEIYAQALKNQPFERIYIDAFAGTGDRTNKRREAFPREDWPNIKQRADFTKPGVYILIGYVSEEDDLPTLYIGQGDVVRARIDSHFEKKDFWSKAVVFVSSAASGGLNRAHATWLEHAMIMAMRLQDSCKGLATLPTPNFRMRRRLRTYLTV